MLGVCFVKKDSFDLAFGQPDLTFFTKQTP